MDKTEIKILVTQAPLKPFGPAPEGCGAVVEFSGIVRGEENGGAISALEYQAYQPMAEREIERLIHELLIQIPCASVRIAHRTGIIPVGESAIILQTTSRHRGEAFSFATAFMDRLKQEVPIWKIKPVP
jgi:molybdopterin synthase catalytic subunit